MKRVVVGIVMALLLGGPVAAECIYHGVVYSEGARVCMHRTMYMCRGERWVKTAERCWEWSFKRVAITRDVAYCSAPAEPVGIQHADVLVQQGQEKPATP